MSCDVTDIIFDLRVAAGKIFPQKIPFLIQSFHITIEEFPM